MVCVARRSVSWLFILGTAFVIGCGSSAPVAKKCRTVSTKNLPKIGQYIGTLDDGRIEVAGPDGWEVPSRSKKWLVRFRSPMGTEYPSIIVHNPVDFENVPNVNEENVAKFAKRIARSLKAKGSRTKPTVTPIKIGKAYGVTYQKRGKAKSGFGKIIVDRVFFETAIDARKYKIELRAREGTGAEAKSLLMAVVNGIKFLKAPEEKEEPKVEEKKPAEKKVEAKPEKKVVEKKKAKPKPKKKATSTKKADSKKKSDDPGSEFEMMDDDEEEL